MDYKSKEFKIIVSILICIILVSPLFSKFTAKKDKVLIEHNDLIKIKKNISEIITETDSLYISRIEGNKDYMSLSYRDNRYSGENHTYNILYDIKRKTIIKNIEKDNNYISLIDSSFIKHVKDNIFLVLDKKGSLYTVDINKNIKVTKVDTLDIDKDSYFKNIFVKDTLYIIRRDFTSKYNEKALTNPKVYKIKYNSKNHDSAIVSNYEFDKDDFIYSFVINTNLDIGVVLSKSIFLKGEEVNKYRNSADKIFLENLPSENNNYKIIDVSSFKINYLESKKEEEIPKDILNLSYSSIESSVKLNTGVDFATPSNIPLVVGDSYSLYSSLNYYDILYDLPILPSSDLNKYTKGSKEFTKVSSIRSDILWYNYKDYITFINTDEGLYGINENGEISLIVKSLLSYVNDTNIIYLNNGSIYTN